MNLKDVSEVAKGAWLNNIQYVGLILGIASLIIFLVFSIIDVNGENYKSIRVASFIVQLTTCATSLIAEELSYRSNTSYECNGGEFSLLTVAIISAFLVSLVFAGIGMYELSFHKNVNGSWLLLSGLLASGVFLHSIKINRINKMQENKKKVLENQECSKDAVTCMSN